MVLVVLVLGVGETAKAFQLAEAALVEAATFDDPIRLDADVLGSQ